MHRNSAEPNLTRKNCLIFIFLQMNLHFVGQNFSLFFCGAILGAPVSRNAIKAHVFVPRCWTQCNLFPDRNEGKLWSNRTGAHLVLIQPLVDQSGARPKIERREPTLELEEFGPDEHPLHMYENNLKPIWPPIRERPSNLIRQEALLADQIVTAVYFLCCAVKDEKRVFLFGQLCDQPTQHTNN
jgi:hypothetical protein